MYLVDTTPTQLVKFAKERRLMREKANAGVREFFAAASRDGLSLYLSVVTIGEVRKGVERIRRRGDAA